MNLIKNKTTLSERWDGSKSQNHCMFGSVDGIFYSMLAGIKVDDDIEVAPYFAENINKVCAKTKLANGEIAVSWERKENGLQLKLDVIGNIIISYNREKLSEGHYEFLI